MGDADSHSKPQNEDAPPRHDKGRRGVASHLRAAAEDDVLEEDISIHIFTTSATLVGVCLTVIGLFKVIVQLKSISTWGDDLLSVDALLFLVACLLSYRALRTRKAAAGRPPRGSPTRSS